MFKGICAVNDARFAVVGKDSDGSFGVLNWFICELSAFRFKKFVNANGGDCKVEPVNGIKTFCTKVSKQIMCNEFK